MLLGLIVIFVVYIFSCVSLTGLAEWTALKKNPLAKHRDVITDMLSQKFYIIWFLPWWLAFVVYRLIQMRREYALPHVEPVTQEDTLPRAEATTQVWTWLSP